MGITWDGTGINCYVMGQTNMSHGQSWNLNPWKPKLLCKPAKNFV